MADDEPIEVYLAESAQQAHFLMNLLADAGIQARVVGDISTLGIRPGEESGPILWVRRCDSESARQILAEWDRSHSTRNRS